MNLISRSRAVSPRRGSSLVIVLGFVVLVTGLVVAFFTRVTNEVKVANSSANLTKVDLFSQGAMEMIIGDLKQEIAAGSILTNVSDSNITLYLPKSSASMVPSAVGSTRTGEFVNLVKRSANGLAFYSGTNYDAVTFPPSNRAVKISTTTPSANGRFMSAARWNKALLLPKATPDSDVDFTPSEDFIPPDWIMVARDGSNPTSWSNDRRWNKSNPSSVIARYAYNIYDVGGLLDVNVAGYPSSMTTNQIGEKGSLAMADLTVIGLKQAQIDSVVGWRNFASIQAPGAFPNPAFNPTSATNYYNYVISNIKGFLRTGNTALFKNQSDRMFSSRQQMIKLMTSVGTLGGNTLAGTQNALQYLTTFTRDLEQPSFIPDPNRPKNTFADEITVVGGGLPQGGNDAYSTDGSVQDRVNPSFLTIRDQKGEPLFRRRFPLSRLALVATATAASADAQKVYDYFGLRWDSTNEYWVYDHGGGAGVILSLSQIPKNREPDFFEILRASIHCDSLGKQHGGLDGTGPVSPHTFTSGGKIMDGRVNFQILQIGANIIDQYDEDSYPTVIFVGASGGTTFNLEFYGTENIPYLYGWQTMWYRMRTLTVGGALGAAADINGSLVTAAGIADGMPSGNIYETWVMLQPVLWNPHAPDANIKTASLPTNFRVSISDQNGLPSSSFSPATGGGSAVSRWWSGGLLQTQHAFSYPATTAYQVSNGMTSAASTTFRFPLADADPNSSILTFGTGSGAADFREPYRLRAANYPSGSNASNDAGYPEGKFTVTGDPSLIAADGGDSTVIGFFMGKSWTGPAAMTSNFKYLGSGTVYNPNPGLRMQLEYQTPSGSWRTYDTINHLYIDSQKNSTVDNLDVGSNMRSFKGAYRMDPRTSRWGLFGIKTIPSTSAASVPTTTTPQIPSAPGDGVYAAANYSPIYYLPQGISFFSSSSSLYSFTGYSAGGCPSYGWRSANTYLAGDLVANLPSSSLNANAGTAANTTPGLKYYYADPDGVFRRSQGSSFSGNDGLASYTGNYSSRPAILNRPFRSVAELGYTFRGQAWKELDFSFPESGDAALLDAFCLNELDHAPDDVRVAGRINLNTRQTLVLESLIRGTSKAEGGILANDEAQRAAQGLVDWTTASPSDPSNLVSGIFFKGPLRNRSELVGRFVTKTTMAGIGALTKNTPGYDPSKTYKGYSSLLTSGGTGVFSVASDAAIKRRRESVIRALADAGNTRTWNLLIDLVAQVGRYPEAASNWSQFVVEGEVRLWIHLAIDRYTGQVIDRSIESITE